MPSGELRQLAYGKQRDYNPAWSPDGKRIDFLSTRQEKPQTYQIAVDGGDALPLTALNQGVGDGPLWSPDGKQLAFTATKRIEARAPKKTYGVQPIGPHTAKVRPRLRKPALSTKMRSRDPGAKMCASL